MEIKELNELKLSFLKFLIVEKNYSDKTIASYNNDIAKFFEFLKNKKINEVNKNIIHL